MSLADRAIYSVAARLATIPSSLMLTLSWQVIFPMYTRLLNAGTDLQVAFARVHRLMGGFGAFMISGILMFFLGGLLALGVRTQLARWSPPEPSVISGRSPLDLPSAVSHQPWWRSAPLLGAGGVA